MYLKTKYMGAVEEIELQEGEDSVKLKEFLKSVFSFDGKDGAMRLVMDISQFAKTLKKTNSDVSKEADWTRIRRLCEGSHHGRRDGHLPAYRQTVAC